VKPFRRPGLHPPRGCVALTAKGLRCGRPHFTAIPITFSWDPVKGVGIGAPAATLCRMHDYLWELEPGDRVEVVGGWLGRARNEKAGVWTVLTTVCEAREGFQASLAWWALRRNTVFGDCSRDRETFDDARAAA